MKFFIKNCGFGHTEKILNGKHFLCVSGKYTLSVNGRYNRRTQISSLDWYFVFVFHLENVFPHRQIHAQSYE